MSDIPETPSGTPKFDFSAFPPDTLFFDRRDGEDRRDRQAPPTAPAAPAERREKKDRRRRIDPTTFEKQYTTDELEFMSAMQKFKERSGKAFPSYAEVLTVARSIGYRRAADPEPASLTPVEDDDGHQPVNANGAS